MQERSMQERSTQTGTQSLDRAMHILRVIADAPPGGLSAREVAAATLLSGPTTYRLLQALEIHGMVARRDGRRYLAGRQALALAAAAFDDDPLHAVAAAPLREAARLTGVCVSLLVRHGCDALCLTREEGIISVGLIFSNVGSRLPLGAGPGSMVLLSHLPESLRHEVVAHNAGALVGRYFSNEMEIHEAIGLVLREDVARDPGLLLKDVHGLAVPVRDSAGTVIAAVGISAVRESMTAEREARIVDVLRHAAGEIGRRANPATRHVRPRRRG